MVWAGVCRFIVVYLCPWGNPLPRHETSKSPNVNSEVLCHVESATKGTIALVLVDSDLA